MQVHDKAIIVNYVKSLKVDSHLINFLFLIYLLIAIVLSPGGSTHLHTNNT